MKPKGLEFNLGNIPEPKPILSNPENKLGLGEVASDAREVGESMPQNVPEGRIVFLGPKKKEAEAFNQTETDNKEVEPEGNFLTLARDQKKTGPTGVIEVETGQPLVEEKKFNPTETYVALNLAVEETIKNSESYRRILTVVGSDKRQWLIGELSRMSTMGLSNDKDTARNLLRLLGKSKGESSLLADYSLDDLRSDLRAIFKETHSQINISSYSQIDRLDSETVRDVIKRLNALAMESSHFASGDKNNALARRLLDLEIQELRALYPEPKIKKEEKTPEALKLNQEKEEANKRLLEELKALAEKAGQEGLNQWFLDKIKECFSEKRYKELLAAGLDGVRVVEVTSASVNRVVGQDVTRPVFYFSDDESYTKFCKSLLGEDDDSSGVFLPPKLFSEGDLAKTGMLITGGGTGTVIHEMMHSVDPNLGKRKGPNRVLDELFAYYNDIVVRSQIDEKGNYQPTNEIDEKLWDQLAEALSHEGYMKSYKMDKSWGRGGMKSFCNNLVLKAKSLRTKFGDIVTLRKIAETISPLDL